MWHVFGKQDELQGGTQRLDVVMMKVKYLTNNYVVYQVFFRIFFQLIWFIVLPIKHQKIVQTKCPKMTFNWPRDWPKLKDIQEKRQIFTCVQFDMISIATKLDSQCQFCLWFVKASRHVYGLCESKWTIICRLMELIIVHEAEGVNKSPHLESATFAHSAEQNDLIHVARRNCLLGKRPKESGNNTELKWHSVT